MLSLAAGGVLTEVLDDAPSGCCRSAEGEARDMLADLRSAPLLRGHRGRPALDERGTGAAARDASPGWPHGLPAGSSLDLNPVLVTTDGAVVLDAALATRRAIDARPEES